MNSWTDAPDGLTRRNALAAFAGGALLALAYPSGAARAQQLASPFGTVSQRIDSTTLTVEYYRPSARGRAIFGRLVPWGQLWTPGANWATTLEVNREVRLEGQPLPSGKYSMWVIPGPEAWTVTLSRAARRFHTQRAVRDEQLRVTVRPDSGPPMEVLTFSFPEVTREGATLQLAWANTVVPIRLQIGSALLTVAAAHPWSTYTGVYQLRGSEDPNSTPVRYEIMERNNGLWVRTGPEAVEVGLDPEFDLLPAGGDQFHPRQYKNGKLVGVEADELIVFQLNGGRATGFEVRGIAEAKVLARAIRRP